MRYVCYGAGTMTAKFPRDMTKDDILAVLALKAARKSRRIRAAHRRRQDAGLWRGGSPPYGYRLQDGRLVADPAEQGVIGWMEAQRQQGASYALIAAGLNDRMVPTRLGGMWHASTVRNILERTP